MIIHHEYGDKLEGLAMDEIIHDSSNNNRTNIFTEHNIMEKQNIQPIIQCSTLTTDLVHKNLLAIENDLNIQNYEKYKEKDLSVASSKGIMLPNVPVEMTKLIVDTESTKETQPTEKHIIARTKYTQKIRPEEAPFEFFATPSSDAIENPTWIMLVSQLKGKNKKSKKQRQRELLLPR